MHPSTTAPPQHPMTTLASPPFSRMDPRPLCTSTLSSRKGISNANLTTPTASASAADPTPPRIYGGYLSMSSKNTGTNSLWKRHYSLETTSYPLSCDSLAHLINPTPRSSLTATSSVTVPPPSCRKPMPTNQTGTPVSSATRRIFRASTITRSTP